MEVSWGSRSKEHNDFHVLLEKAEKAALVQVVSVACDGLLAVVALVVVAWVVVALVSALALALVLFLGQV